MICIVNGLNTQNCTSLFNVDLYGYQCFGLNQATSIESISDCKQACCDTMGCNVYEYCNDTVSVNCSPKNSCWIGEFTNNCVYKDNSGWLGGRIGSTIYMVNISFIGKHFDGIGGLSGGGATSRLLYDYSASIQSDILDYLFKPNFGANLNILKTEIPGDTFSGCGTETSHMHTSDDINYKQGYEYWMMREAKRRNKNIKIYGLPWGFPSWIGSGALNDNQVTYIINWIKGAMIESNATIDYIGVWNEDSWSTEYVKKLRIALDNNGFNNTQIVVADNAINSADTIVSQTLNDNEFNNSYSIIGIHYPPGSESTNSMINISNYKTLWSSEDDSSNLLNIAGDGCLARIINWNYVKGNYTSTIVWNLITSYYNYLHWYGDSFMIASQPWSGNYQVNIPIWISAHTMQFTQGNDWYYTNKNYGSDWLTFGGSFVTYVNKITNDFSIVIETMTYNESLCIRSNPGKWNVATQNITFQFDMIKSKSLHYWQTIFGKYYFEKQNDIMIDDTGIITLYNVEPNTVITLSTTNGQTKGSHGM